MSDHARGCEGRNYTCTCGHDAASTALVEAARFLADRLEDFRQKIDDIDDEREFEGHIIPALARLRTALSASQSTSREGER